MISYKKMVILWKFWGLQVIPTSPKFKDVTRIGDTADGKNPKQPPGMYKTL